MEQEAEMERGKRNRDEEQQGAVVAPPPPAVAMTPPNQRIVKDEPVDMDQQQPPTIKREDEAMDRAEIKDMLRDSLDESCALMTRHAQVVQENEALKAENAALKAEKLHADGKVLQAENQLRADKSEWRGLNKTRTELLIAHRLFGYAVTEARKQSCASRLTLNPWLLKIVETERHRIDRDFSWMATQAHCQTGCYWHKISFVRDRTCFGVENLFKQGIKLDTELSDEPSDGKYSVMVLSHWDSKVEANTLNQFLVVGALSATPGYLFGKADPSVESLQLCQSCAKCPGFKKLWPGKQFPDSGLHYIEGGKTVRYSEEIQAKVRRAANYSQITVKVDGAKRTLDLNSMFERDVADPPNPLRAITWVIYNDQT